MYDRQISRNINTMTDIRVFLFENVYCNRIDDIAEYIRKYFLLFHDEDVDVDLKTMTIEFRYNRACSAEMPNITKVVKECIFSAAKLAKDNDEITEEEYEFLLQHKANFFVIGLLNHGKVIVKL